MFGGKRPRLFDRARWTHSVGKRDPDQTSQSQVNHHIQQVTPSHVPTELIYTSSPSTSSSSDLLPLY